MSSVKNKLGEEIHEGDFVGTKWRGGTREGEVKHIATSQEEVKNPPKVIFDNQRGKEVAHNPETLLKGGKTD